MVAFVGPSGVGKTSVLDLTIGLLTPNSGTVSVDGHPLSYYDVRSWRSHVAYVAQDTVLFHDTIASNIAWGDENAIRDDIVQAAKLANAHEFIVKQPDGYDTVVGDRGTRISGGQRQRLALARALIRRPALLILDEATSELDTRSENLIKDALNDIRGTTTIMIVAHRYSTVGSADTIYLMEDGIVAESGNMTELLAKKGRFHDIYMSSIESDAMRRLDTKSDTTTDFVADNEVN
jgi:ABC-type multidrug transport system fused ATPase/permease subunit